MDIQRLKESTHLALQDIPCFADSMACSVLPGGPGPSLVHLTGMSQFPFLDFDEALKSQENFFFSALKNPKIRVVRTRDDLISDKRTQILFGMRYPPNDMTLERMEKLKKCGLGVMSIAYGNQNQYGDGVGGTGKLTSKGKDLLQWMDECELIPDLSGAGYITMGETLNFILSERLLMKPMASHSGCYTKSLCNRDLTDNLLRRISHLHGYIGIPYTYPEDFMNHAKHAFKIMLGWGKIGICSHHACRTHFEIVEDLARENLDPRIFGLNFEEFLKRALPPA